LAAGADGAQEPRRAGHLDRLRGWAEGFPDAIVTVFPEACVQLCIVHMVRHSLNFVAWKRRAEVAADIKRIYGSDGRRGGEEPGRIRSQVGKRVPDHWAIVASKLGKRHSLLRSTKRNPQGHLHNQCDRVGKHEPAAGDALSRHLPERRRAFETVVLVTAQHQQAVDAPCPQLAQRPWALRNSVRKSDSLMHCAIRAHDADFVPTPQGLPEAMLHAEMRPPSGRLPLQR